MLYQEPELGQISTLSIKIARGNDLLDFLPSSMQNVLATPKRNQHDVAHPYQDRTRVIKNMFDYSSYLLPVQKPQ